MLFIIVQVPQFWPTFAARLASALEGDTAWILDYHYRYSSQIDLERSGVSCNDRAGIAKPNLTDVVDETLDVLSSVSRFAMAIFGLEADSGCEYWPVTPPERFTGPWDRAPRNPILIMSNNVRARPQNLLGDELTVHSRAQIDPITPLVNARTVNNRFGQENSRLVIQNSVGVRLPVISWRVLLLTYSSFAACLFDFVIPLHGKYQKSLLQRRHASYAGDHLRD